MGNKKELLKNTAIIAIGKCSTQIVSFLLLPLYTSALSTTEYGVYDFINTLVLFLVPCITLLMEEAMFRFLIDTKNDEEKSNIITQSLIYIISSMFLAIILLIIVSNIIKYEFKYYLIFYLVAAILNGVAQALARGLSKIKLYSFSSFLSSSITIGLNVVLIVVLKYTLNALFISYIIANIISAILIFSKVKINKFINFKNYNELTMKEMVKYAIPLVPNSVAWVIIDLSDRLIITAFIGASMNGVYAIANKFPSIINTFYGFFYMAWKESAAKALNNTNSNEYYNSIYRELKRFLFAISICLIAVLPFVFKYLINQSYSEAYEYIPILIISILFNNISGFYGGIFTAYKSTKIMGTSTIYSAIINIIFNLLFIKELGVAAAVGSTLISNLLVCFYRKVKVNKYVILERDNKFLITSIGVVGIILICYYSKLRFINFVGFIIAIVYSLISNRNMINTLIKFFKSKISN